MTRRKGGIRKGKEGQGEHKGTNTIRNKLSGEGGEGKDVEATEVGNDKFLDIPRKEEKEKMKEEGTYTGKENNAEDKHEGEMGNPEGHRDKIEEGVEGGKQGGGAAK